MYLAELDVTNFRCLKDLHVEFQPGLNVVLGENNAGKSALLDALRHVLNVGWYRREIYFSEDDFWHDGEGNPGDGSCELHATFKDLSEDERGHFSVCLAPSLGEGVAQIHLTFSLAPASARRRIRVKVWGGETEGDSIPAEVCDGIMSVYLEPLRDPRVGLMPRRGSRISRLLDALAAGDAEKEQLTSIAQSANKAIEAHALMKRAGKEINKRLRGMTGEFMAQSADLRLSPPDFRRIAESIRARAGKGQHYEIEENGLGYNNLLYTAAVLGELQQEKGKAEKTDYAALLIEEPEAHLHPHLQTVLIDYLESVAAGDRPVQVFVTSHSPTLASRVGLDAINLFYFGSKSVVAAFPVAKCELSDKEKRHLRRYLDVTKAQLFFARGVVLVEGVSEALLLPELARINGWELDQRGVSVVNVQSLAFRPFARLFQADGIGLPVAIVTDADPGHEIFPPSFDASHMSDAARGIRKLENGNVRVFFAAKTLEYDLALAGNAERMAEEYRGLRPRKATNIAKAVGEAGTARDKAEAFVMNFDSGDKAEFAQRLAESISGAQDGFQVPGYIADALAHVVGTGEEE